MKKPSLKNHFIVGYVKTIGELWGILHLERSIYVRSWGRLHPCKFFLNNDRTFTIKRLEEMIDKGEFLKVISKKGAGVSSLIKYFKSQPGLMNLVTTTYVHNQLGLDETFVLETSREIEHNPETGSMIVIRKGCSIGPSNL